MYLLNLSFGLIVCLSMYYLAHKKSIEGNLTTILSSITALKFFFIDFVNRIKMVKSEILL